MTGVQTPTGDLPVDAQTKPEQQSVDDLHDGGFRQGRQTPWPFCAPEHVYPVQQSAVLVHPSGLMQQCPFAQTWPAGQQTPLQQVSPATQQLLPHVAVPVGHSH
jgi:hypothetical protein